MVLGPHATIGNCGAWKAGTLSCWLQGTPIMIGGGVLAYTLLGVAFNATTGAPAQPTLP